MVKYDISTWSNYDFTNNAYDNSLWKNGITTFLFDLITTKAVVGTINQGIENKTLDWNELGLKWSDFGNSALTSYKDILASDENSGSKILQTVLNTIAIPLRGAGLAITEASSIGAQLLENGELSNFESGYSDLFYNTTLEYGESLADTVSSILDTVGSIGGKNSYISSIISNGMQIYLDGGLRTYVNGIDETSFGRLMESSWSKGSGDNCFRNLINNRVYFTTSTPFNSGEDNNSLYGNMILGAPPVFTNITDPKNRSLSETFLRDAKFLTLTPGFPKYNGNNLLLKQSENQYNQTTTAESMLNYLLRNGLDSTMLNKDKRYYTFKTDYDEYYKYLETMLNTLYIKLGLSNTEDNKYNLFTFFKNPGTESEELLPQYKKSFGFFVNPQGVLTESIANMMTSYGTSYASEVNSASDTYQQLLYTTGYGTGGKARNAAAKVAKAAAMTTNMKSWVASVASNTIAPWTTDKSILSKTLSSAVGAITDARKFLTETDQGAALEAFATTNGMKIVYPELWYDSNFTRSITINFEFVSPYGDPASIFHYVLAPFAALFCYACPRQAADNGYVSPFFIRADIPGLFTSDLALIADFTWIRGGNNDLWTKDGLPRAISGSFTIQDLYPFLAMTKRLSFMSSNPNYTTFLDNMASLHVINSNDTDTALNDYWKQLLERVSGESTANGLWNKSSTAKQSANNSYANANRSNRLNINNISWIKN